MFQHRFNCRSVEYNYVTLQCQLSDSDRRTAGQFIQFVDAQGVDYFENLCLKANQACKGKSRKKIKIYCIDNTEYPNEKLATFILKSNFKGEEI